MKVLASIICLAAVLALASTVEAGYNGRSSSGARFTGRAFNGQTCGSNYGTNYRSNRVFFVGNAYPAYYGGAYIAPNYAYGANYSYAPSYAPGYAAPAALPFAAPPVGGGVIPVDPTAGAPVLPVQVQQYCWGLGANQAYAYLRTNYGRFANTLFSRYFGTINNGRAVFSNSLRGAFAGRVGTTGVGGVGTRIGTPGGFALRSPLTAAQRATLAADRAAVGAARTQLRTDNAAAKAAGATAPTAAQTADRAAVAAARAKLGADRKAAGLPGRGGKRR